MKNLLAVVVLVAVSAALYHFLWLRRQPPSLEQCRSNQKNLATSLEMYAIDNAGRYPKKLDQLLGNYLKELPTCPATGTFTYSDYQCSQRPDLYSFSCVGDNHAHSYGKPNPDHPRFNSRTGGQEP